jgi:hypothetical protein
LRHGRGNKTAAAQGFPLDEVQHFPVMRDNCPGKAAQGVQDDVPLAEASCRQFTDHERMAQNPSVIQHVGQDRVAPA